MKEENSICPTVYSRFACGRHDTFRREIDHRLFLYLLFWMFCAVMVSRCQLLRCLSPRQLFSEGISKKE